MNPPRQFHRKLVTAGLPLIVLSIVIGGRFLFAETEESIGNTAVRIVPASEVEWTPLNPARGDASPQAGTLWGDRAGFRQTSFLVKFADGFSSPPHIHNVTYRGVVLSGEVHNDDPEAEEMWMPSGSYWTQPASEVHITSAQGKENIAYIEIERGPYLVQPPEEASDNGERPVNVHASNVMWLDAANTTWIEAEGTEIAFLWGKPEESETNGTMLRLAAGQAVEIRSNGAPFKAVVIQGQPNVETERTSDGKLLTPGSYILSKGTEAIRIASTRDQESILYFRTEGKYEAVPVTSEN